MTDGVRIILTREKDRNRDWAGQLQAAGLPFLELPLVRFESLPVPDDFRADGFDWICFTSPQGVKAFAAAELQVGKAQMASLGAGTARALAEHGFRDKLGIEAPDGAAFALAFLARMNAPGRMIMPGPERRLEEPAATFRAAGWDVVELPLYKTSTVPADELPDEPFTPADNVFFCSPSAVRAFAAAWDQRPRCTAIGQTTADALKKTGFSPAVAAVPDLNSMIQAAGLDTQVQPVNPEMES